MPLEVVTAFGATVWGVVCIVIFAGDEVAANGEVLGDDCDCRSVDAAFNLFNLLLRRNVSLK